MNLWMDWLIGWLLDCLIAVRLDVMWSTYFFLALLFLFIICVCSYEYILYQNHSHRYSWTILQIYVYVHVWLHIKQMENCKKQKNKIKTPGRRSTGDGKPNNWIEKNTNQTCQSTKQKIKRAKHPKTLDLRCSLKSCCWFVLAFLRFSFVFARRFSVQNS